MNLEDLKEKALEAKRLHRESNNQWDDATVASTVPELADAVLELIEEQQTRVETGITELTTDHEKMTKIVANNIELRERLSKTEAQLAIATEALKIYSKPSRVERIVNRDMERLIDKTIVRYALETEFCGPAREALAKIELRKTATIAKKED